MGFPHLHQHVRVNRAILSSSRCHCV
jgi:hypothetical protein